MKLEPNVAACSSDNQEAVLALAEAVRDSTKNHQLCKEYCVIQFTASTGDGLRVIGPCGAAVTVGVGCLATCPTTLLAAATTQPSLPTGWSRSTAIVLTLRIFIATGAVIAPILFMWWQDGRLCGTSSILQSSSIFALLRLLLLLLWMLLPGMQCLPLPIRLSLVCHCKYVGIDIAGAAVWWRQSIHRHTVVTMDLKGFWLIDVHGGWMVGWPSAPLGYFCCMVTHLGGC